MRAPRQKEFSGLRRRQPNERGAGSEERANRKSEAGSQECSILKKILLTTDFTDEHGSFPNRSGMSTTDRAIATSANKRNLRNVVFRREFFKRRGAKG